MKKISLLLSLILFFVFLSCDNNSSNPADFDYEASIAGRVLPAGILAVVTAVQGDVILSAACDINGYYTIDELTAGSCQLEVKAALYGTYRRIITLTGGGLNQVSDIIMGKFPYPITNVSPTIQSEWNSINSAVSITFALPMDTATTANAFTFLPATEGSVSWSNNYSTLSFRPAATLQTGASYSVIVDTTARTVDNWTLEFPLIYTFSTEPFRVSSSNPATGSTNWGLSQSSHLRFNAPAICASVESAVSITPATALNFSWNGSYLYIKPVNEYWCSNTQYTVTVADSAKDCWGHKMEFAYSYTFLTEEAKISSITPANGQENVPLSSRIRVNFNTNVNKATVESAFRCADNLDIIVGGTFEWGSNNNFSFYPTYNFMSGMLYTASIDTTAKDFLGGAIDDTSFYFTTEAFKVSSTYPDAGTIDFGLTSDATIEFSNTCNKTSVEQGIYAVPPHVLDFTWSGNRVYIGPENGYWRSSTYYKLVLKDSVMDVDGNMIPDSLVTDFTTAAGAITSVGPVNNQDNVYLTTSIYLYFSASMDPASVAGAFSLMDSDSTLCQGTVSWDGNKTSMVFDPTLPLHPATLYVFSVDTTATDKYGMAIAPVTSQFTTESFCVSSAYPQNGMVNVSLSQTANMSFNAAANELSAEQALSISPAIAAVEFSWSSKTMSYRPRTKYWKSNTMYTITLDTKAKDLLGNSISEPFTQIFYTQPVRITSYSPDYNQTGVNLSTAVSISFNTAMDAAAMSGAITCIKSADSSAVAGTVNGSGTYYNFTPAAPLDALTTYIVTVDTTAADAYGVTMSAAWNTIFTTGN